MVQIDNVKMWESLIRISKEGDNLIGDREIGLALKDQGLEYKDGKIVSKEEIKGNQREVSPNPSELTEFEREYSYIKYGGSATDFMEETNTYAIKLIKKEAAHILSIARKQITSEIDVDAVNGFDLENAIYRNTMGRHFDAKRFALDFYRKGIEDTIKKIKEG